MHVPEGSPAAVVVGGTPDVAALDELIKRRLDEILPDRLEKKLAHWFKRINWNIPNAVQAPIPGFESLATFLMQRTMKNSGVADIMELRSPCVGRGWGLSAAR